MALTTLPLASGKRHKGVFESLGWTVRSESNHIVLTHPHYPEVFLSIPNHPEVKKQTLKKIVRDAGLSDEQYAVFFHGITSQVQRIEDDEDLFRETIENGQTRVHCMKCGQQICHTAEPPEIAAAKENHPSSCAGSITA
jgi:predicted RNA binding protein YcfA (HicA-like mRNA interferase family)